MRVNPIFSSRGNAVPTYTSSLRVKEINESDKKINLHIFDQGYFLDSW
jgi:hypothetical protein